MSSHERPESAPITKLEQGASIGADPLSRVIQSLPLLLRLELGKMAEGRHCTPEVALADAITSQLSLDEIRGQGWAVLAEKNGTIFELSDA